MATFKKGDVVKLAGVVPQGPVIGMRMDEDGNVSYRQLGKFTLSQAYNVEEKRRSSQPGVDREPFEPLYAELNVRPFRGFSLFAETGWDYYDRKITFADVAVDLTVDRSGGRKDRFRADYLYGKEEDHESLLMWFDVNLVYGLSAGSSYERALNVKENISTKFWVQYLRQCWGLKLIVKDEDEDTSVMLEFQLIGLGDTRWD